MNRLLTISLLFAALPLWAKAGTPPFEQREGYVVRRVQVPVSHGESTEAYLLLPDGEQKGAVLALHDHGAHFTIGKEKLCRPILSEDTTAVERGMLRDAEEWVDKVYDGAWIADTLAAHGYVVLVMDAPYWGSRCPADIDWTQSPDSLRLLNKRLQREQPTFYEQHLEKTSEPWFETMLADDKAGITYLLRYASNVGVFGFSFGGYRAWQLAAEDSRVTWCAAANWMTTLAAHGGPTPDASSWSMYRPRYDSTEYSTIASKMAPRPFLLQYGLGDHLFPVAAVREAIATIEKAYGKQKAFQPKAYIAKHKFTRQHREDLLDWLKKQK